MNKKGSISVETIIIIILALVVLVILAAAFAGGFTELWKKIFGVSETVSFTNRDIAIQSCNTACTLKQKYSFCQDITVDGGSTTCTALRGACAEITC